MKKIIIIGQEVPDEPCQYCGQMAELRPYGINGAKICYQCGSLPENYDHTVKMMDAALSGMEEIKPDQNN